ncbi:MAG: acetyl-CoA carboxylase biotin carboxyl carrier protein [Candidatus Kapabacteria bacterium]|jgi:acetyl-CoA carboxylase biotin carboxyl carrier protein|nr:acetyl-CoA carboxylase biotin carboxyl carrier protein [Candidatus Kapabacteria bacterium]
MDLGYIERLLKLFDDSTATELTVEEEGSKISIAKTVQQQVVTVAAPIQQSAPITPTPSPVVTASAPTTPTPSAPSAEPTQGKAINSPMVGTFYRSSSPEAPPFVQVGDTVSIGTTLCIVEAMKLMNEIESDVAGTVLKVLVENGKPVEYNQPLFLIG